MHRRHYTSTLQSVSVLLMRSIRKLSALFTATKFPTAIMSCHYNDMKKKLCSVSYTEVLDNSVHFARTYSAILGAGIPGSS